MHYGNQSFDEYTRNAFQHAGHGCGGGRFGRHWGNKFARHFGQQIPVNIFESEERFELHVFAPGLTKEDFKISVSDDVLTISYQTPENTTAPDPKWVRQEYNRPSFERRFMLSDKVDQTGISARYTDGVLIVTLAKKPGSATPSQEIGVA
jgi:HSP20 family protein